MSDRWQTKIARERGLLPPVKAGKKKRREQPEYELQVQCADWLRVHGILFQHSPNEGLRHPATGKRLKRAGMSAGFPDIAIYSKVPNYPNVRGVALELKSPKGRLSPPQERWMNDLRAAGWEICVVRSFNTFLAIMDICGFGSDRT